MDFVYDIIAKNISYLESFSLNSVKTIDCSNVFGYTNNKEAIP